jgi:hypothetical protein
VSVVSQRLTSVARASWNIVESNGITPGQTRIIVFQCTRLERRERVLRRIKNKNLSKPKDKKKNVSLEFTDSDPLPFTSPRVHYHMSESKRYFKNLTEWLGDNTDDPSTKVVFS